MAVRVFRAFCCVAFALPMLGADGSCSVSVGDGEPPPMMNEYDADIDGQWEVLLSGANVVELTHPERETIPGEWRSERVTLDDARVAVLPCRDRDFVCPLEVLGLVPTGLLRIENEELVVARHQEPSRGSFGEVVEEQTYLERLYEDGTGSFLVSNLADETQCAWRAEVALEFVNEDSNFVRAEALLGEVTIEYDADCLLTPEGNPLADDVDSKLVVSETFDAQWAPITD